MNQKQERNVLMSLFTGKRLHKEIFQIDTERMRRGWYSDAYFANTVKILEFLSKEGYTFQGQGDLKDIDLSGVQNGDLMVEMQFFTRRKPFSLVAGVLNLNSWEYLWTSTGSVLPCLKNVWITARTMIIPLIS